ncbi:MAG: 2-C-methyl-D-erythritol 4-phosphate cytidylyltransferase [Lachnospiraceae bacterium]|jgi:2-C-methyl-D-erythritol 4-phosphate cytidylyltransferase|nr:2-C-methyl-D-erythritol 4-phosphate cytidylyltransferase [Lachnospiraceae bacterium]MCH4030060.1 2-C-methyl-D-erythritol 4-phosphate cytidylyltransferase [Lachnospiraceae bacterium]MCH4070280.1 2-C-methyl-D-erythritol 4-phosphate cytidylyltransferase [Lachnospiraceae bacterium]MCH4107792.1 2-C-methyl-D-erythritol 4-phosphate cytidylyltransferase [Lachnospiraceae bacterium]MCI1361511.1 2-C-methyl-D-erythritol 4-phosphate cytidylyltransferase [Lachnospiraceae bacterium]
MNKTIALIIAGGSGQRMHQDIPKQFITVNEKPVIVYTLEAFQDHPEIDAIAVVCIAGWENVLSAYARQFNITKLQYIIPGGENGQSSIRNGIFELQKHFDSDDIVLIHDAIRPMVSADIISDCIVKTRQFGNAITVIPCAEAMMETSDGVVSTGSYPRENLKRTQTPQGFKLGEICQLHRDALKAGITNSVASCTLMIEMGKQVYFSHGSEKNIKLTTVEDIDIFKALLQAKRSDWLK